MKKISEPISFVVIEVISHEDQRYDTCGDWYRPKIWQSTLHIRTSKLPNDPHNYMALAVAYHELGEALLCLANGIDEKTVDKFDFSYKGKGEPGDDPKAPYHLQHSLATACERILISGMNICWGTYEKAIEKLPPWKGKDKK